MASTRPIAGASDRARSAVLRKALVVGAGVLEYRHQLDLADTGYDVYLVETHLALGNMAQLGNKTFSYNRLFNMHTWTKDVRSRKTP